MFGVYIDKLSIQLPWLTIFIVALLAYRRTRATGRLMQAVGAALLVIWLAADWLLFDPSFGASRHSPELMRTWVALQRVILPAGLIVFAIGFWREARPSRD